MFHVIWVSFFHFCSIPSRFFWEFYQWVGVYLKIGTKNSRPKFYVLRWLSHNCSPEPCKLPNNHQVNQNHTSIDCLSPHKWRQSAITLIYLFFAELRWDASNVLKNSFFGMGSKCQPSLNLQHQRMRKIYFRKIEKFSKISYPHYHCEF